MDYSMSFYTDVKDFHIAFGQRVGQTPAFPIDKERELRRNLLKEEYLEYLKAELEDDFVEVADALADLIYIACGTAVSYGIPLDKIFEEVHNSNMSKLVDGKPMYREDGKVMKPEGWKPPNIKAILDTSRDYNT
jgi:predicted HAD superfamily Cof-like phosphohydrolase